MINEPIKMNMPVLLRWKYLKLFNDENSFSQLRNSWFEELFQIQLIEAIILLSIELSFFHFNLILTYFLLSLEDMVVSEGHLLIISSQLIPNQL